MASPLNRDKVTDRIPEWKLQTGICSDLDSYLADNPDAFAYAAGLEGVRLHPGQRSAASAQGMKAGEPDLRFYLPAGRLLLIELKADKGRLNEEQKARHALLGALGFVVHVVKAKSQEEACAAVWAILRPELA